MLNGSDITSKLWQLAGAFDDSKLGVKIIKETNTAWGTADAIVMTVKHEFLERPMVREILLVGQGGPLISVMHNVEFYLKKPYRKQGIGAYSLALEAMAASQLQFAKIVANAANHPDVGWVVWPKLGYDAIIDDDILQKMRAELDAIGMPHHPGTLRISDLWDIDRYDLWETYGAGCIMEFDVSSADTWSMKRIAEVIGNEDE